MDLKGKVGNKGYVTVKIVRKIKKDWKKRFSLKENKIVRFLRMF